MSFRIDKATSAKQNCNKDLKDLRIYAHIIQMSCSIHESYIRGGFRGGVRDVRPPKIRKAYVIQR
jgi:hypothetical protein